MTTRAEIIRALQAVEDAGCRFSVSYPAPNGGVQAAVSPETIADCILDGINLPARVTGLTPEEYADWVRNGGSVQCAALTNARTRCRKFVSGHFYSDPIGWKALNDSNPYCSVHGGE